MIIEPVNRKDGTRIRNKKFPYLKEGQPAGSVYDRIVMHCKEEQIDNTASDILCQKLETWHKVRSMESKIVAVILPVAMVLIIPLFCIPVFSWGRDTGLWKSDYGLWIFLALFGVLLLIKQRRFFMWNRPGFFHAG